MANTISTTYTLTNSDADSLTSTFRTSITNILTAESQPMQRLQAQRDEIDVRKSVYTDLKTNFDALQTSLKALISTQADYSLTTGVKASVTPTTTGTTVVSATLTSQSAMAASYDISVTQLARAHSQASEAQISADVALGKTGAFWLGGTGTASMSFTGNSNVTAAATSVVATGQTELATGTYNVEIRESGGSRQFRIVDADGKAVSIAKVDGTGYTSDWQTNNGGTFDTKRGFSITLNGSAAPGSSALNYTAKGVSINIDATDNLREIAAAINEADQPEGREFKASIIGKQLVLTAKQSGTNHSMIHSSLDDIGLGTDEDAEQTARDAIFSVNGLSLTRSSNTNLTDVIDGVTLSLAGDAEGKSATLDVTADYTAMANTVSTMVSKYNAAFTHLTAKLSITSTTTGDETTYTRSTLTGDTVFRTLRIDLANRMSRSYATSGEFSSLEEIGLTLDDNLKLTLDQTKFTEAMQSNPDDVTALLDKALGSMETMISTYTGSTGSLSYSIDSMEDQAESMDTQINRYTANLKLREASLINQYMELQLIIADWGNVATSFGIDLDA